jgi:hypothetical protein
MYAIIIEWDGRKPPTTFYKRRDALVGRVRGDKDLSPLERRSHKNADGEDKGVIIQESVIVVASETIARAMYHLVIEMIYEQTGSKDKARSQVHFGSINIVENMNLTEQDMMSLYHIQSTLGRTGRPPADELEDHDFVVTCSECVNTTYVRAKRVINCPCCFGTKITIRRNGTVNAFDCSGSKLPLIDTWVNSRFTTGNFEVPVSSADNGKPVPASPPDRINATEEAWIDTIAASGKLLSKIDNLPRESALRLLDRIFVAKCYTDDDKTNRARAEAAVDIFTRYPNFDASKVRLFSSDDEVDLFDAACFYKPSEIADLVVSLGGAS